MATKSRRSRQPARSKKPHASQSVATRQRQRDKHALRVLQQSGLYSGKIDLRKSPSKYQRSLMDRFSDVIAGKATVLKPSDPKSYKGLLRVKSGRVIVPKHKGERIKLNKAGEIIIESKTKAGKKRTRRYVKKARAKRQAPHAPQKRYGIPLMFGDGRHTIFFPSFGELEKFMEGYEYKDWQEYVVEETIDFDERFEDEGEDE